MESGTPSPGRSATLPTPTRPSSDRRKAPVPASTASQRRLAAAAPRGKGRTGQRASTG
jgi:hypothetical protein